MTTNTLIKTSYIILFLCFTHHLAAQTRSASGTGNSENPLNRALPEIRLDNVALDDVMAFLRDVSGGFQPTVVRDPGVPAEYPKISLQAKNITIGQVLQFLNNAYGITSDQIEGPVSTVTVIKVPDSPLAHASVISLPVKVYDVRYIVERIAAGKQGVPDAQRTKQALSDVLSLVEAALAQTEDSKKASLKVHEGTQALVLKGSAAQHELLVSTLQTIGQYNSQDVYNEKGMLEREVGRLNSLLSTAEVRESNSAQTIRQLETQLRILNDRLTQAAGSTTRPKE